MFGVRIVEYVPSIIDEFDRYWCLVPFDVVVSASASSVVDPMSSASDLCR